YGIEPGEGDDDTGDNGDDDGSDDGDDDDQDEVLKGDLNSDGYIDSIDITLIRRYLSGSTENIDTDAADMNNDTAIDSLDYALLRRKLLGR
ncbi:MAG: dockerin type I domain-containing protein, partial [Halanaerobiaceae bacterium]